MEPTSKSNYAPPQRRLHREHRRLGSWRAVAKARQIENVKWVFNYAIYGTEPTNNAIRVKLGLKQIPCPRCHHKPVNHRKSPRPQKARIPKYGWMLDIPSSRLRAMLEHREPML